MLRECVLSRSGCLAAVPLTYSLKQLVYAKQLMHGKEVDNTKKETKMLIEGITWQLLERRNAPICAFRTQPFILCSCMRLQGSGALMPAVAHATSPPGYFPHTLVVLPTPPVDELLVGIRRPVPRR
jgi:hypothetical protein